MRAPVNDYLGGRTIYFDARPSEYHPKGRRNSRNERCPVGAESESLLAGGTPTNANICIADLISDMTAATMAKSSPKKVDLRGTGMRNRRIASDSDLHIALLEAQGSAEALLRNYQAISVAHPELSEKERHPRVVSDDPRPSAVKPCGAT